MTTVYPRICIITPGHIASAPRVVKEADALAEEGFKVHVVSGRSFAPADKLDTETLAGAKWECTRVPSTGPASILRKARWKFARRLAAADPSPGLRLASTAIHPETAHLGRIASALGADLYIGHCIPGLAAAAFAARRRGSLYGFDAEDFHDAETIETLADPATRKSVRSVQSALLPGCSHFTASSPLICEEYLTVYGIKPVPVLNVFPKAYAPSVPVTTIPVTERRPAVIYWFSQTIGPGRGLEQIIEILGRMTTPTELHLRGFTSPSYAAHLGTLAARATRPVTLRILEPGFPAEMSRLAAQADLGLAIEQRTPRNRDLCLTNKIFVYLLAGIPQLLSDTAAQSRLAAELGEAALLRDLSQTARVAGELDIFFQDGARVSRAREAARARAFGCFCWDIEKTAFVDSVRRVLAKPPGSLAGGL